MHVCMYVYIYVCVDVYVCADVRVCVCVCVCMLSFITHTLGLIVLISSSDTLRDGGFT